MNIELEQIVDEVARHRRTVYLHAERVKDAYIFSRGVTQLGSIESTAHGAELGLPAWLATISAKVSRNRQIIETREIGDHPGLMAALLEANYTASQEVLKLSLDRAPHDGGGREPVLLKFSGPSFLTLLGESLFTDRNYSKLSRALGDSAVIEKVEENRSGQERTLRLLEKTSDETVTVWIAAEKMLEHKCLMPR